MGCKASLGYAISKPLWIEVAGVRLPDVGFEVQGRSWDPDIDPFPKADSGERHVCEDLPWGEGSRRVQVHGFIYHHRQLHTCIIQEKLKCIWIFNYSLKTWDSGALFTTKMVIQDATSFIFESMS